MGTHAERGFNHSPKSHENVKEPRENYSDRENISHWRGGKCPSMKKVKKRKKSQYTQGVGSIYTEMLCKSRRFKYRLERIERGEKIPGIENSKNSR